MPHTTAHRVDGGGSRGRGEVGLTALKGILELREIGSQHLRKEHSTRMTATSQIYTIHSLDHMPVAIYTSIMYMYMYIQYRVHRVHSGCGDLTGELG